MSPAISAAGSSTNRRQAIRGCGSTSDGPSSTTPSYKSRSMSMVRGPHRSARCRPSWLSIRWATASNSPGVSVVSTVTAPLRKSGCPGGPPTALVARQRCGRQFRSADDRPAGRPPHQEPPAGLLDWIPDQSDKWASALRRVGRGTAPFPRGSRRDRRATETGDVPSANRQRKAKALGGPSRPRPAPPTVVPCSCRPPKSFVSRHSLGIGRFVKPPSRQKNSAMLAPDFGNFARRFAGR